jgi:hypothetical protein
VGAQEAELTGDANADAWKAVFVELSEAAAAEDCPQREARERAAWDLPLTRGRAMVSSGDVVARSRPRRCDRGLKGGQAPAWASPFPSGPEAVQEVCDQMVWEFDEWRGEGKKA